MYVWCVLHTCKNKRAFNLNRSLVVLAASENDDGGSRNETVSDDCGLDALNWHLQFGCF